MSSLDDIELISVGSQGEAASWERQQEHQALQDLSTGCPSKLWSRLFAVGLARDLVMSTAIFAAVLRSLGAFTCCNITQNKALWNEAQGSFRSWRGLAQSMPSVAVTVPFSC